MVSYPIITNMEDLQEAQADWLIYQGCEKREEVWELEMVVGRLFIESA